MDGKRKVVLTGLLGFLTIGCIVLPGCGGEPQPGPKGQKDAGKDKAVNQSPQKMRVNSYKSPVVFISDAASIENVKTDTKVTIDGLVTGWEEDPRPGEKNRFIRLVSFVKTPQQEEKKCLFDCAIPPGTAEFAGVRLEHIARIQGTVARIDKLIFATVVPLIVLKDCKLVSVTNDTLPLTNAALDAIKGLQGKWKVASIEGGQGGPQKYGLAEIRFTDSHMVWRAQREDKTMIVQNFGYRVDPEKSPKEMNLYRTGYHMTPVLYEQKGDSLRICLRLPIDDFSENTPRPTKLEPGEENQVVIQAERVQ